MQTLAFRRKLDPDEQAQLQDAILAAYPALAGTYTQTEKIVREDGTVEKVEWSDARLRVESTGTNVTVTVPDDADTAAIEKTVRSWKPTPAPPSREQALAAMLDDKRLDTGAKLAAVARYIRGEAP